MSTFILFLKGIVIGIGKVIPGVSGAILAISFNIYDKGIDSITNFFKDVKNNSLFLLKIGTGILLGIILFSKIINYTLTNYYTITMLFFIGLIIGGIGNIRKEVSSKYYIYTIITLLVFTFISILNINNNYILKNNFIDNIVLFVGGIIESLSTVIPGLSSTAMLLIMGIYNIIISAVSNLNIKILFPFILGIISSIYFIIKFISYTLNNYKQQTYSVILGLLLSNIIILIFKTFTYKTNITNLIIGLLLMIIGIFISYIQKEKNK